MFYIVDAVNKDVHGCIKACFRVTTLLTVLDFSMSLGIKH